MRFNSLKTILFLSMFLMPNMAGCGNKSNDKELRISAINYKDYLDISFSIVKDGNNHKLVATSSYKDSSTKFLSKGSTVFNFDIYAKTVYEGKTDLDVGSFSVWIDDDGTVEKVDRNSGGAYTIARYDSVSLIDYVCSKDPLIGSMYFTSTHSLVDNTKCEIRYRNYDGTLLYETSVNKGGAPQYLGSTPTRPSEGYTAYQFKNFGDYVFDTVSHDMVYIAHYTEIQDESDPEYTNLNLKYTPVSGGYEISYCYGTKSTDPNTKNGIFILPSTYEGEPVVSIKKGVFAGRSERIKELRFGSNIRTIGDNAFQNCHLYKVVLNNGLQTIGDHAFYSTNYISGLIIPKTVTTIKEKAFSNALNVDVDHTIYLSSNVTTVGLGIFIYTRRVITICCEHSSKPSGWDKMWHSQDGTYTEYYDNTTKHNVNWGVKYPY